MKETKLVKRIFAGFVAFIVILLISCGDLKVFADNYSITNPFNYNSYFFITVASTSSQEVYVPITKHASASFSYQFSESITYVPYYRNNHGDHYDYFYRVKALYSDNSTVAITGSSGSPTALDLNRLVGFVPDENSGQYTSTPQKYYFNFSATATPTPEPTPTPVPTPTPEPTFNPDQPTYTTFFNHLLNDGNNALNALYLSWTQANNKFYTGIFFIGLPIMIGIFGIVASIFFGGDD